MISQKRLHKIALYLKYIAFILDGEAEELNEKPKRNHVPRGSYPCKCGRVFTTPQGKGQHLRHGCENAATR